MSLSLSLTLESTLGTLARLFAAEGAAQEVAVLTFSTPEVVESHYDNWNGGTTYHFLHLQVPLNLYPQIEARKNEIEDKLFRKLDLIVINAPSDTFCAVRISPAVVEDPKWREKASAWLAGSKVTNQGRVRSDNVAPLTADGLLFRSQSEIHLYKAFKALGISFAPLPVFIRGGSDYRRIEPDFVLIRKGIIMVVEVDGDTVHHETPAEAHARTTMLLHEGACFERILSSECDSPHKATQSAEKIIRIIDKIHAAR